jgi:malic enzyme
MVIASKADYQTSKRLFPQVGDIRKLSVDIAVRVCEVAQELGVAGREPPRGMKWREFVEGIMWNPEFYYPTVGV